MLSIFLKPVLLLSMPGGSEWILILLVVLLFFGGKKIPDLMRGIGKGVREFNDAKDHMKKELETGMKEKKVDQSMGLFVAKPEKYQLPGIQLPGIFM